VSVQATFSATLCDEWVSCGVSDAVICPGSRSTPLALALADRFKVHVKIDERSAAFFALGLALESGRPAVICVTSGTAAVELHPAVVEAHQARVPLIVCTADRPSELHGIGAPQTIEQPGVFGSSVRWAEALDVPTEGREHTWRPLARRAFDEAVLGPSGPGPVHLNLAFREPLTGAPGPLPPRQGPGLLDHAARRAAAGGPAGGALPGGPLKGRGLLVVGGLTPRPASQELVSQVSGKLGWPVLADPRSRCRVPGTIAAADSIVRAGAPVPEAVVVLGAPWMSKALSAYISQAASAGARVVAVDPWRQWPDPWQLGPEVHHVDADNWLRARLMDLEGGGHGDGSTDSEWLGLWRSMEERAQRAIADVLGEELSEPHVARAVYHRAADLGATLFVSASMPLRDLEWFAATHAVPPRVLANRGVNGIDGVTSTAFGIAASIAGRTAEEGSAGMEAGRRTIALLGDVAFLHDVSALVNLPRIPCTLVVIDNGGGGIFSFLPQAEVVEPPTFEVLFGTPPTSDVSAVARGFGLPVREVGSMAALSAALDAPTPALVRVSMPSRAQNVVLHEAINEAVRLALR
jgi:2-succinyl-5-enolpyruvyl-6-hydroxy-3-cyclohexene-1-carboxylate synthase